MELTVLIVLLVLSVAVLQVYCNTDKVFCYYPSWAVYDDYDASKINPNLCTHLYYAFGGIDEEGSFRFQDDYVDIELGSMGNLVALKDQNPNLKVVISIGGWNEGSTKFSNMVSSKSTREIFISTTLAVVEQYRFDGVDIDWEYPAERGGVESDRENFITLLKEFKETFGERDYLLTAAIGTGYDIAQTAYDISGINQYLDYILLMTYDYHGYYDSATGSNSPLYAADQYSDDDYARTFNIDFSVNYWMDGGASPDKLILGIPLYGKSFTLSDPSQNSLGAPVTGCEDEDDCSIPYVDLCQRQQDEGGWTKVWQDDEKVPYIYKDSEWISYDDAESIALKVQYAKEKKLGGVMIWSLGLDDFEGKCGDVEILLTTINNNLGDLD